ncbi:MAG: sulfatase-like hydrolase/transferase [Myxococcaceae bacterium]|nr:sulfatase-like hydrolase/transferase [Myxococcaceae bacterium]
MRPLDTFRFRLTVLTAVAFLAMKLWVLKHTPRPLLIEVWCFEACTWLWLFTLSAALSRVKRLERLRVPSLVYALLYVPHFVLCFGTVYFFDDARIGRYTLVDFDADALDYLKRYVNPRTGLGGGAALLAGTLVAALATYRVRLPGRPAVLLATLTVCTIGVVGFAASSSAFPTPVWRLIDDLAVIARYPRVQAADREPRRFAPESLDRAPAGPVKLESHFKRVVVLVMEEVTLQHFVAARARVPDDNFFARIRPHEHVYSNVFATNMDSHTGVLALLGSRFVPYEAYKERDIERYKLLQQKRTLIDLMRENGYHSVFASAQVLGEGIVDKMPWDEHILLTEPETKQLAAAGSVCVNPYRFEDGCEDGVMLPRLFERLERHEKLFWFQPTIWGHSNEYSLKTHKSDVQYYGEVLGRLVAFLEQKGLAEETLIVVVADHGRRTRGTEHLAQSYQIPLVLYAPGFERVENDALHSQLDLQDIIRAAMTGTEAELKPADVVLFIGQSYLSIVGAATREHDFMVIKNRRHAKYVLNHVSYADPSRFDAPPRGDVTPGEVLQLLGDYREYFQSPEFR